MALRVFPFQNIDFVVTWKGQKVVTEHLVALARYLGHFQSISIYQKWDAPLSKPTFQFLPSAETLMCQNWIPILGGKAFIRLGKQD